MHLCVQDIVADGNIIWFTVHDMAAILKYDRSTGCCEIEAVLPGKYLDDELIVGLIYKMDNIIVLAPIKGVNIYLYDIDKRQFISSSSSRTDNGVRKDSNVGINEFYGKAQSEDAAILLGKGHPGIAVCRNRKVEEYKFPQKLCRNTDGTFKGFFGSNAAVFCNKAYIPVCNAKELVVFDLNENRFVGKYDCVQETIACCADREGVWLVPQDKGELQYINLSENKLYAINDYPIGFCGMESRWFQSGQCCNDAVVLFPYKSNMLLRVNVHTHEMTCVIPFEDCETIKYTCSGVFDEKHVWGFYYPNKRLDIIDCQNWSIESIFINYPVNILNILRDKGRLHNDRMATEKILPLNDLIRMLKSETKDDEQCEKMRMSVGEKIWKRMKGKF